MNVQQRKAVSPIIATLLLIAIAVASGIIVYVFTAGLAGNLTKSGGSQVTDQISTDAYNFQDLTSPVIYLRNTGSSTVSITSVYFAGTNTSAAITASSDGTTCPTVTASSVLSCTLAPGGTVTLTVTPVGTATTGASYAVKFITADGAQFTFNVVAGQTG